MKVIGLTGSIATGKTTVLNIFKKFGYPTVSCDDVYHKLLKKDTFLKYKLVRTFGKQILDKKGNISLRSLSQVISKSIKNLYLLEKITHPRILKEVFHKVKQFASKYKNNKFCIIDVPLLFEKKLNNKFDYIITVYCSKKTQLYRLKRRKIPPQLLNLFFKRQMSQKKKIKMSDFVIRNDKISKQQLRHIVKKIISILKNTTK